MLLVEDGIELVSHLSQQQPQINIAAREHDIVEVKARDIEELFDERIEPVRLVERHARKCARCSTGSSGASCSSER